MRKKRPAPHNSKKPGRKSLRRIIDEPTPERITALLTIRDAYQSKDGAMQCRRLETALETLGTVSTFEASRYLDLYDPHARKRDLIKLGRQIGLYWGYIATEAGAAHRIGVYFLIRGATTADAPKEMPT